jgi:hypothetical protein
LHQEAFRQHAANLPEAAQRAQSRQAMAGMHALREDLAVKAVPEVTAASP